ncbi:MAG: mannitol dehydrogenase family protein [Rhodobacteraceae bacterium]|nr:mannitol dehydrogenase family protein [Paracoccaceae bacterium]
MKIMKLSNAMLAELPMEISRPRYNRSDLKAGIIHVGLGNFHRAHQAWYLHRLMQEGLAQDWAVLGAGVRPNDAEMRIKLLAQDCLTTLIELDPSGISAEITGAMIGYLPVEENNKSLILAITDPAIRIVSLTITEGGYFIDPVTGGLDAAHPDIQHDIANPDCPRTVFGAMIAALKLRRAAGHGPFTVQSCDNLQGNGAITRQTVVALARLTDPDLAGWIDTQCSFPNSMVDCIVPATGPKEIAFAKQLGINDAAPVTHENYRQWVIEDDFCAGRPDWDKVGAIFTDSVHPYETMKIRILNAGHQIIANVGELLSVDTIADCMAHPLISAFFSKVQRDEIVPYVEPVPDMAPAMYVSLIEKRFANKKIHDTTRRVAFDGSSRHPGFVLPILRDALAVDGPIDGLVLVEAIWAHMCAGTREDGRKIVPNDPQWDRLLSAGQAASARPDCWIEQRHIYGDLTNHPRFAQAFRLWHELITDKGCEVAIQRYIDGVKF